MLKKQTRKGQLYIPYTTLDAPAHLSQALAQTHAEISPVGNWTQILASLER